MCNGEQENQNDYLEWFRSTGEPINGYIDGNYFLDKEVQYSEINGLAIFEGDIVLGKADEIRTSPAEALEDGPPASGIAHGIGITGPGDIAAVRALYPDVGPIQPGSIATPQELRLRDGNGRDLIIVSGYATFNFKGRGSSWIHRDIHIPVGPRWMRLDDVCASVSLASVSNSHHAVNAGFATDNCRWTRHNGRALLQSRLAVRDSDGYLHRVVYNAALSGRLR
jgi:hypothetical protein